MNLFRICLAGMMLSLLPPCCAGSSEPTSFGANFSQSKIAILATMQQHCRWVSKGSDSQVRQNLENAGFHLLGPGVFGGGPSSGSRAYVAEKDGVVVIAFRGTLAGGIHYFQNVATDARPIPRRLKLGDAPPMENAKVHTGFQRDYNKLRPNLLEATREADGKQVYICGHSLGAALATICAYDLSKNYRGHFASLTPIVSGSPKVGDEGFKRAYEAAVPNHLRVAIYGDPITNMPGKLGLHGYVHVGRELLITADGTIIHSTGDEDFKKRPVHARPSYHAAVEKLIANLGAATTASIASAIATSSAKPEPKADGGSSETSGWKAKRAAKKAAESEKPGSATELTPWSGSQHQPLSFPTIPENASTHTDSANWGSASCA